MAAPNGIKWGGANGGAKLGIYYTTSSTDTSVTFNVQIWIATQWSVHDQTNTLTVNGTNYSNINIYTTNNSGGGWSANNHQLLKEVKLTYNRESSASTKNIPASMTGVYSTNGTMSVSVDVTVPAKSNASVTVKFHRNHNGSDTETYSETYSISQSERYFGMGLVSWGYVVNGDSFGGWTPRDNGDYKLLGWSTDRSSTSAEYATNNWVYDDWINDHAGATVNLYAIWAYQAQPQVINTSKQNADGSWTAFTQVYSSAKKAGDTVEWTSKETDEHYGYSVKYTVTESILGGTTTNVMIYRKTNTITYDANGGGCAPQKQTFLYGCNLYLSPYRPVRSGYIFLGWSTSSTAESADYTVNSSYDSKTTSAITLYAVWQRASQDIYLCDDGTSYVSEYIEGEDTISLGSNGELRTSSFSEDTISNGDFAISSEFIAKELCEGEPPAD